MTKARIMGRAFEISEERLRGGVVGTHRESIGPKCAMEQSKARGTPSQEGKAQPLPVRSMPIIGRSGSNPDPSASFASKWEAAYAAKLEWDKKAGLIRDFWYQPFSFKLANGRRYRPDFMVWTEAGIEMIEVKGWHANIRDSLTHVSWAADKYRCYRWRIARRIKQEWQEEEITP